MGLLESRPSPTSSISPYTAANAHLLPIRRSSGGVEPIGALGRSLLPSDLWSSRQQPQVQFSPLLLSSAAEIVARQRLVEQLEERLLFVSDNLPSGVSEDEELSPEHSSLSASLTALFNTTSEPEQEEAEPQGQETILEEQSDIAQQPSSSAPEPTPQITYFSTLTELFLDLINRDELCLAENLSTFSTRNLNMLSDNSEQSSDEEATSSVPTTTRKRPVAERSNPFTVSSKEELKKSFHDLINDVRNRCGLCHKVSIKPVLPVSRRNPRSTLDRRKKKTETSNRNIPTLALVNIVRDRERMGFRARSCHASTVASRAYTGGWTQGQRAGINNRFLPNRKFVVDTVQAKTFCVGYTDDGIGIMTASQDHKLRLFAAQGKRRRYSLRKMLDVPYVGWSILDVGISPDGRDLVYSTWNDAMFQCNIHDPENNWIPLRVNAREPRFALFSLRFNSDGTEIVGGASDQHLYIYNRDVNKCVLSVKAHEDDVNAVCFGDQASHIILSGGDDGLCKVWDRRTMGDFTDAKPVGILAGHRDGIVFIDSRGDDRYVLTNCKDQTVKVWDLRNFGSETAIANTIKAVASQKWDYRWQCSPMDNFRSDNLEDDCSVATIRGHSVLHTLIRARFSPDHTGRRYIYSGCGRGGCVVYDLLTQKVSKLYEGHSSVVRDVAWHPHENEIVTTSWDGKTKVWRFDERALRCINPDSCVTGDENSCDENYDPIKRRFLKSRQKLPYRKRSAGSFDYAGQPSAISSILRKPEEPAKMDEKTEEADD